ncbi:MAG TPA: hypothetical protein ENG05_00845 [Acidilobales archaeon]|nr:hypothetical protein [Acidilobales archaeon]
MYTLTGPVMAEETLRMGSEGERESIAETHLREQLITLVRNLEDELRELALMIRDLDEGKSLAVERRYSRIKNIKDSVESMSINLIEYIIRTAPALMTKDVYAALIQDLLRAAEHVEAAAYRNLLLSSGEFTRMSDNIFVVLDETVKKVISMVGLVGSMLSKLGGEERVLREAYMELLKTEVSVDEYYREAGIQVIKYYANKDVGALLLVKELFDKIEETADILSRVGTYIRYLSISR